MNSVIALFVIIAAFILLYSIFPEKSLPEETPPEDPILKEIEQAADPSFIPTHPTYTHIEIGCSLIVDEIKGRNIKIDKVVGVLRGGKYPAELIAQYLHVPVEFISYSSKQGQGDNKDHDNVLPKIQGRVLLIVDDIADSGKTIEELFVHYVREKHTVFTAVLYYKDRHSGYVPDFYWKEIPEDFGWIYYPWETES